MRDVTLGGRYLVGDPVGTGATATVYRAEDLALGRHVAIKLVRRGGVDSEDACKRFLREAQLAARFQHPGAVEVFAIGEYEQHPYLVMALVEAPTLAALLAEENPLPVATVSTIGGALADVLAAAHAQNVVHRDVKPANVFVEGGREPTRVRLADFGLAFARDQESLGRLTEEGITLGTPYYMAPEQVEGKEVTSAADVYALCATLYEALARRPPFQGQTIPTILAGHLYLPPIPLSELDLHEAVPPELENAILAGLAKTPSHRPDAASLAVRLRDLTSGRGDRTRLAAAPPAKRVREPVRVWTEDAALADALLAVGITVQRECDVEVLVVTDELPSARSSAPSIVVSSAPSPAWVTAAIRAGHAGAARWPGDVQAIVRVVERFGRIPSSYPRDRERTE